MALANPLKINLEENKSYKVDYELLTKRFSISFYYVIKLSLLLLKRWLQRQNKSSHL